MEKRAIIAAMLMAGLLMVYQFMFVKPEPQQTAPPGKKAEAPVSPGSNPPAASTPGPVPATSPPPAKEIPRPPERMVVVDTPLYRAEVGSNGGEIKTWVLRYRGEKPLVVAGLTGSEGLEVGRAGAPPQPVAFSIEPQALKLTKENPAGTLTLAGGDGFGLEVKETLGFHADSYVVEQSIKVENRHSVAQSAEIILPWRAPVEWPKELGEKFQGQHPIRTVRLAGGSVIREDVHSVAERRAEGSWIALESEWYLAALIPQGSGWHLSERKISQNVPGQAKPRELVQIEVRTTLPVLEPGQAWEGKVTIYVGPKEHARLKGVGAGLEKSIYFGGFPLPQSYGGLPMEWLAVPIMALINIFHAYSGNYGVAIILLTIITKVLFFPLTLKSMTSMKAMQTLQPQINALRSKYKSDPQRLQRETMELYRANKVNPLGGCLPMVVQIPIFYALYVALSVSVEMQNAPFICFGRLPKWMPLLGGQDLWICDLAAYDPTYILPLLMGASMFVQQKMQPVMGDPRQAKMMLFMPVLFTFMFLNLPSGLVLYWTLSNVFQIAQQKYMERGAKNQKPTAQKPTARALKKA
jgi:YidC/Oxa1 family membrane protein insertase